VHVEPHHKLHKKVNNKMVQNNVKYKLRIDVRNIFKTFNIGDVILLACNTDPFQILKELNYHVML